jgi:hypothetical protein
VVMDRDKTIIAYFKPEIKLFALTIGVEGKGTTNPEPGTYTFIEGGWTSISAVPAKGYEFVGWSGDYGSSLSIELTMDRDVEIIAIFQPKETGIFLDQVNDPADHPFGGAINITPEWGSGQSIVTQLPVLVAVEVYIYFANEGRGGDTITMTIMYKGEKPMASLSQYVEEGFEGWLMFEMPEGGIYVGKDTYLVILLEDTGKNVFHWARGAGDTYPSGTMVLNGEIGQYDDFFFRTYGTYAD